MQSVPAFIADIALARLLWAKYDLSSPAPVFRFLTPRVISA